MNTKAMGLAVFGSFVDSLKQKSSLRIQSLKKAGQLSGYKGCRKAFSEAQGTYAGNVRSKIEESSIEQGDILAHEIATFNMALNSPLVNYTRMVR
jgi:glutamate dehydrogenase/leucine dehydrogenase